MAAKQPKLESALGRVLSMRTSDWLTAHMDDFYERSEEPRYDPGWLHPSALSNPCDAFLAFEFLGLPQTKGGVDARRRRLFDNGHSTEGRKQEALLRAGVAQLKTKKERSFEIPQYRIRGECDNVVKHPLTGELYIWEHKTMNTDQFKGLTAPLPSWVVQVHCYMFGKGILQAIVEVEDKNDQREKRFLVPFDMTVWRGITERVERILERLGQRLEVPRIPPPNDSQCTYYPICAGFDFGAER